MNKTTNFAVTNLTKHEPAHSQVSERDYLTNELSADFKSEYVDGQVLAMAGASFNHNLIVTNVVRALSNHLQNTQCATLSSDMKLKAGKNYYYPDVLVVCDRRADEINFVSSPRIVVEVVSKSTRKMDTSRKLIHYLNIASLEDYLLVEQDIVMVTVFSKSHEWRPRYFCFGDTITLDSIDMTLSVDAIYNQVINNDLIDVNSLT